MFCFPSFLLSSGLSTAYATLLPLFGDLDSPLYHGQVTSHLDPSRRVLAVDPTGQDTLVQPSSGLDCFAVTCTVGASSAGDQGGSDKIGGLPKGALIGIVVAAGVIFLGLLAFGTWYARKEHQRRNQASFDAFTRARQSEMVGTQY